MRVIKQLLRKFGFSKSTHKSFRKLSIMFSVETKSHTCDIFILPLFEKFHNSEIIESSIFLATCCFIGQELSCREKVQIEIETSE